MPHQIAVTVHAPLLAGQEHACQQLLHPADKTDERIEFLKFSTLAEVHFARIVILPESFDLDGQTIAASVVYMADVDGPARHHLWHLVNTGRCELDQLFSHCELPRRSHR